MSDYPDYPQLRGSEPTLIRPTENLTAEDGTPLQIIRGSATRRAWIMQHRISDAEYQVINTLFRTRQREVQQPLSFTVTSQHDGVEYNAYFAGEPRRIEVAADQYQAQVPMIEAPP